MIIRLAKDRDGKPPTLTCIRDDGTRTWQQSSEFFAYHDLIHYAVETTLGYREAFWGLVARGRGLDDFGTRGGVKDTYTVEESWAERIVGALQWPALQRETPIPEAEWLAATQQQFADLGEPIPEITLEQFKEIRARARTLRESWRQLPAGEALELAF